MNDEAVYHLYLLLCDQKIIYTGIAIDPETRLQQHQTGHPYGAKFTRRFKQLKLVYQIRVGSRADAQKLELKIKILKKTQKEQIIKEQYNLNQLIELTGAIL
ncbi:MAG: GIY-YIG nuclease family protein [Marinicella sp.]|nr:GIY-YIG nuclease family protein [Xanthomonadales bacterium]